MDDIQVIDDLVDDDGFFKEPDTPGETLRSGANAGQDASPYSPSASSSKLLNLWQDSKKRLEGEVAEYMRRQEALFSQALGGLGAPGAIEGSSPLPCVPEAPSNGARRGRVNHMVSVGDGFATHDTRAIHPADVEDLFASKIGQGAKLTPVVEVKVSENEVKQAWSLDADEKRDSATVPTNTEAVRLKPTSIRGRVDVSYDKSSQEEAEDSHKPPRKSTGISGYAEKQQGKKKKLIKNEDGNFVEEGDTRTHHKELSAADVLQSKFENWLKTLPSSEEPERKGRVVRLLKSSSFSTLCPVIILIDAGYSTWGANRSAADPFADSTVTMKVVELLFTAFYTSELALKVFVHRRYFLSNDNAAWNWFDLILVMQALSDVVLTYIVSQAGGSATFLRLMRLLKLGKVLRLFRAIRFFKDLSVMIVAIMNCMMALFWAFCVFGLVIYMFALLMVQTMTLWRQDQEGDGASLDPEVVSAVKRYFGSVQAASLGLVMSTTGGINWIDMYTVIELGGGIPSAAFLFFIGFFGFAVITILSGIFIEKSLAASLPDRESQALEQRRAEEMECQEMKDMFMQMDEDGSGTLTIDEFMAACEDIYVKSYLRVLGLEIHDGVMFFKLLCSLSGATELPIEDFVQRLGRMKGSASAMDLQSLMFEVSILRKQMQRITEHVVPKGSSRAILP